MITREVIEKAEINLYKKDLRLGDKYKTLCERLVKDGWIDVR